MLRLAPRRTLAAVAIAAVSLAACARSDARTTREAAPAAPAAAPAGGMAVGLTDSASLSADRGRIRGAEGAKVWLIEVSDFQCPFCKRWHDQVSAQIDREYVQTGKVRRAFINFPLSSIHANARGAAEAAMCASAQGKFWEMQDALFATQERWAPLPAPAAHFDSLAVAAGVDAAAWRKCVQAHAVLPLIDADHDRAFTAGAKSTPTFFIGNRGLVGSYPIDSFRVVLDDALLKAGTPR